jgi:hypothetical protein
MSFFLDLGKYILVTSNEKSVQLRTDSGWMSHANDLCAYRLGCDGFATRYPTQLLHLLLPIHY